MHLEDIMRDHEQRRIIREFLDLVCRDTEMYHEFVGILNNKRLELETENEAASEVGTEYVDPASNASDRGKGRAD